MQALWVNNSRIIVIKKAKLSGYYPYMKMKMQVDFQICISVPLKVTLRFTCSERKIWSNIKKSENFMTMAVDIRPSDADLVDN